MFLTPLKAEAPPDGAAQQQATVGGVSGTLSVSHTPNEGESVGASSGSAGSSAGPVAVGPDVVVTPGSGEQVWELRDLGIGRQEDAGTSKWRPHGARFVSG